MALGVVQHLLVGPACGALHAGGQPVHADRLAGCGHLRKPLAQVVQGGDEATVRLAEPQHGKLAKQPVEAVADLGLGDAHRSAGTTVRQPVQQDGGNRI